MFLKMRRLIRYITAVHRISTRGEAQMRVRITVSVSITPRLLSKKYRPEHRSTGSKKAASIRARAFSAPNRKSRGMTILPKKKEITIPAKQTHKSSSHSVREKIWNFPMIVLPAIPRIPPNTMPKMQKKEERQTCSRQGLFWKPA